MVEQQAVNLPVGGSSPPLFAKCACGNVLAGRRRHCLLNCKSAHSCVLTVTQRRTMFRHMVGGSIPSLFATLVFASVVGCSYEVVPHQAGDGGRPDADASEMLAKEPPSENGSQCDPAELYAHETQAACSGLTGDTFYGKAYHAECSGSWIAEQCARRGDVFCCLYW